MENQSRTPHSGAKRRRLTKTERASHLVAWKRSGQSARVYAATHGLRAANLYAWSHKYGATGPNSLQPGPSPFVPVRISPVGSANSTAPRIVLKVPGLECVIEGAGSAEAFAALAGALKREVFDV